MTTTPAQIEQQAPTAQLLTSHTDHEMWRLIRNRVDQGRPMQAIADELGLPVDELCEWIFRYREPRPAKPYQSKNGTPIGKVSARLSGARIASNSTPEPSAKADDPRFCPHRTPKLQKMRTSLAAPAGKDKRRPS